MSVIDQFPGLKTANVASSRGGIAFMTHDQFRQVCEPVQREPAEPGPQLRALADVIDEMLRGRDLEHRPATSKLLIP